MKKTNTTFDANISEIKKDNNNSDLKSDCIDFSAYIFQIDSNLDYLNNIADYISKIYLKKLVYNNAFNEIHNEFKKRLFKRKLVKSEYVGVWGWNSWCGIHIFPLLTSNKIMEIYKNTVDVGFSHLEPENGILPHAVLHKNGIFAGEPTYKCYGGIHGEDYNIDNILCWAKMAMEYFLATNDYEWFNSQKMTIISTTVDFFLNNYRAKYNPALLYSGIEGDWTECTNWELDNSDINVNMLRTLELLIECEKIFGKSYSNSNFNYKDIFNEILQNFNKPIEEGGFWHNKLGFYVHGNDGKGIHIEGDKYFESTVNYFSILWNFAPENYSKRIFEYLNKHHEEIENPKPVYVPVLTNYKPRTNARRKNYGKTVTNGDIWVVLGAHATAARLKKGFIDIGTKMYKAILKHSQDHGFFHNSIYLNGSVNDSWDPEVANNGAPYPPLIYGLLGIELKAEGIKFKISCLKNIKSLKMILFLFQIPHYFEISWTSDNTNFKQAIVAKLNENYYSNLTAIKPNSLLKRINLAEFLQSKNIIDEKTIVKNKEFMILRSNNLKIKEFDNRYNHSYS
ncbi:MAG: hypothetical protein ACTSRZ_02440 [Promethearchaeota archaeon]